MTALIAILGGAALTFAACWGLGHLLWRGRDPSPVFAIASGAVGLSLTMWVLLQIGLARPVLFLGIGVVMAGCLVWKRRTVGLPLVGWMGMSVASVYGVYYLVHTLAPEVQPDGVTYHLGLVKEWLRLGRFPDRIGFYEVLPQGLEMLFGFAFAVGKHSAAKLVEFGFLTLSVWVLIEIGNRLGFDGRPAAILYFCAPVVAVSGTCTYTDAAMVFFVLITFLLFLCWSQDGHVELLFHAGLAAGFCYAIKVTGLVVIPPILVALAWRRAWRGLTLFSIAVLISVAPWMGRALWLTGNPLAPIGNGIFPNPFFHYGSEKYLSDYLRSYGGVQWAEIPGSLSIGGERLQGLFGPLLLAAPLALLALRRKPGRYLLFAASVVALPWAWNVGARFLMPAFAFIALALCVALPRRLAFGLALAQAVLCLPPIVDRYAEANAWRLRGFPWKAALRIEPEAAYLQTNLFEIRIAEMITRHVPPDARLLDLYSIPTAYTNTVGIGSLPSAQFDNLADTLAFAARQEADLLEERVSLFAEQRVRGIRVRLASDWPGRWSINDVLFRLGAKKIDPAATWTLTGHPARWDTPLAFDRNLATRWQTWREAEAGNLVEASIVPPIPLTQIAIVTLRSEQSARVELSIRGEGGDWINVPATPRTVENPLLKLGAAEYLRRSRIDWIVVSTSGEGHGVTGLSMYRQPEAWGLRKAEEVEGVALFEVRR